MIRTLKSYLMLSVAMANLIVTHQVRAEEPPVGDINFFLFLADSIVKENELITPVDLEEIEIDDSERALSETNNEEEAEHE